MANGTTPTYDLSASGRQQLYLRLAIPGVIVVVLYNESAMLRNRILLTTKAAMGRNMPSVCC